ncbi:MAG: hypothetical protein ACKPKO_13810, partial [Candidatus Fonsibacter sp.]
THQEEEQHREDILRQRYLWKQVALNQQDDLFIDDEPPQPQEVLAEPQQPEEPEQETPPPPLVPQPEAPAEPPQEQEEQGTPAPTSTTPTQGFADWKRETGLYDASLREFQEFTQWKAADGALLHAITRPMHVTRTLIHYSTERDLYHLPENQTGADRVIQNTTYYRSVVGRRHPQPQPLASVTEHNISNNIHYICKGYKTIYNHIKYIYIYITKCIP